MKSIQSHANAILLAGLVCLALAVTADAKEFYMSPAGSDANPGQR
jgi:hypothetical protein